jgi:hypothetical protein
MIKYLAILLFSTLLFAKEEAHPQSTLGYVYLALFIITVGLFFWGIHKAVKTQKTVYAWALLPFILLMLGMFFI